MTTKKEQLYQLFVDIDRNQDGILSPQEISFYMNTHGYTPEQIQGFWNTFDLNRDGYVTMREFNFYVNSLPPEYPLSPSHPALNGYRTLSNYAEHMNPIRKVSPVNPFVNINNNNTLAKVSRSAGPDDPIDKTIIEPIENTSHSIAESSTHSNQQLEVHASNTLPGSKNRTRSGHIVDEEKIKLIFRYFDKDSSGRLELEELKDLLNRLANGEGDEFLKKWLGTGQNSGLTCDDLIQFLKQS